MVGVAAVVNVVRRLRDGAGTATSCVFGIFTSYVREILRVIFLGKRRVGVPRQANH